MIHMNLNIDAIADDPIFALYSSFSFSYLDSAWFGIKAKWLFMQSAEKTVHATTKNQSCHLSCATNHPEAGYPIRHRKRHFVMRQFAAAEGQRQWHQPKKKPLSLPHGFMFTNAFDILAYIRRM